MDYTSDWNCTLMFHHFLSILFIAACVLASEECGSTALLLQPGTGNKSNWIFFPDMSQNLV